MADALGMIETKGFVGMVEAADAAVKAKRAEAERGAARLWDAYAAALTAAEAHVLGHYDSADAFRAQVVARARYENAPMDELHDEDEDVARERHEVESGSRDATDVVVVKHLRKVYHGSKTLVAVRNLSFGVHKGEVFGFLGTNLARWHPKAQDRRPFSEILSRICFHRPRFLLRRIRRKIRSRVLES
jgi:ATPase subunit of ABC transporter with duplicated ATPase domains